MDESLLKTRLRNTWGTQQPDEVKSINQSRVEIQKEQQSISYILKILLAIFFLAIAIMAFMYIFGENKPQKTVQVVQEKSKEFKEILKEKAFPKDSSDTLFNWIPKFGGSKCPLDSEVENQRFSVQNTLRRFPDLNDIKQNPSKYNLNQVQQKIDQNGVTLSDDLNDNAVIAFNDYVSFYKIDQQSYTDKEKNKLLNKKLNESGEQYKNTEQLLENDYLIDLKKITNDLVNSNKNLMEKRKRVNKYRTEYLHVKELLGECGKEQMSVVGERERLEQQLKGVQRELMGVESNIKGLNSNRQDKENNLSGTQKEFRDKYNDLEKKRQDIDYQIKNEPRIRKEIEKKKQQNINFQLSIDSYNNNISKQQGNLGDKRDNLIQLQQKQQDLEDEIDLLKRVIGINTMKLNIKTSDHGIKEYMSRMINNNVSMEELERIMRKKIDEEEQILKDLEEFESKDNVPEGYRVVIQTSDSDKQQIKDNIEREKKQLEEIKYKYSDLRDFIANFESAQIEIKKLKKSIKDCEKDLNDLIKDLGKIKQNILKLQSEIDSINNKIQQDQQYIDKLQVKISNNDKYIVEKENFLLDYNQRALSIQEQIKVFREQNQKQIDEINRQFSEIDNLLKQERQKKHNLQQQLDSIKQQIKDLDNRIREQTKNCAAYQVYYEQTQQYIQYLNDDIQKSTTMISNLKEKLKNSLDAVYFQQIYFFQLYNQSSSSTLLSTPGFGGIMSVYIKLYI